jgi:hypothetical protein
MYISPHHYFAHPQLVLSCLTPSLGSLVDGVPDFSVKWLYNVNVNIVPMMSTLAAGLTLNRGEGLQGGGCLVIVR